MVCGSANPYQVIGPSHSIRRGGPHWVSIDSALSTSETADYSAISVGYSNRDGHYVHFAERGRWDYETLRAKALAYAQKYQGVTFIVEAAGSGISLISSLRKAGLSCICYRPKEDKMYRAALVLPIFVEGRVFLVKKSAQSAWVEPYVNELVSFPNGRFDDQVDSLVQALRWAEPQANPRGKIYLF
jgi:predicted phage terminase large subunit-like protein